jgi:hypothetical protein
MYTVWTGGDDGILDRRTPEYWAEGFLYPLSSIALVQVIECDHRELVCWLCSRDHGREKSQGL